MLKKAGIELSNDDNKIINHILECGKSKDANFSLEDLLIPFIEEKQAMGLQIDKSENEILKAMGFPINWKKISSIRKI